MGLTLTDELEFCSELIRNNVSHVCLLQGSTHRTGGWPVAQSVAQACHVAL